MKKIILLVVVLIAAYTGVWYMTAQKAKAEVENKLREFAEGTAPSRQFKYDSLTVSGYPFSYVVAVNNPALNIDKQENHSGIKINLAGSFQVGSNLQGTHYWIEREGDLQILPPDGKTDEGFVLKGRNRLAIKVENEKPLQSIAAPFSSFPKELFSDKFSFRDWWDKIKSAEFEGKDVAIQVYNTQGVAMFAQDNMRFGISHKDISPEQEHISYFAILRGVNIKYQEKDLLQKTPQDHIFNEFFSAFDQLATHVGYAKFDGTVDGDASLPKNFEWAKLDQYPEIIINLKKMDWKSELGDSEARFFFSSNSDKDNQTVHVDAASSGKIAEGQHNLVAESFIKRLKTAANNPNDKSAPYAKRLLECCEKEIPDLVPRYDQFGRLIFELIADFDLKDKASADANYSIAFTPFLLSSELYGMSFEGSGSANRKAQQGEFALEITHVETLFKDLVAYYNKIQPIIKKVVDEKDVNSVPPQIGEEGLDKIVTFMRNISDTPDQKAENFKTTIRMKGLSEITIGTLSWQSAAALLQQLGQELFPAPKPVAKPAEVSN